VTSGKSAWTATSALCGPNLAQLPVSRWHEQIGDPAEQRIFLCGRW